MGMVDKQNLFAQMAARLIVRAGELGYQVAMGEAWRSPEEAKRLAGAGKGIAKSLHCDKLALDLNLFRGGVYIDKTEDHRQLGEWWESIGGSWGGRFGDGNHYSLSDGGRK